MKFYLSYFKLRFIAGLQYRFAAVSGIFTQFFFGLTIVMVYLAFYESGAQDTPMTISELVTYLWLNQIFYSLLTLEYRDSEILKQITNGEVAYELVRPKSIYFMWYFKCLGQRLSMVALRSLPFIATLFLLPSPYKISLPNSIASFILFIISILIGTLLMCGIVNLYNIITLKTLDEKGVTNIFGTLADIFSGGFVPLPFFPTFLQKIADLLPFKYVSDLSYRIYSGNIPINECAYGIIIQVIWTIIVILIGVLITKKQLKRVTVQGG